MIPEAKLQQLDRGKPIICKNGTELIAALIPLAAEGVCCKQSKLSALSFSGQIEILSDSLGGLVSPSTLLRYYQRLVRFSQVNAVLALMSAMPAYAARHILREYTVKTHITPASAKNFFQALREELSLRRQEVSDVFLGTSIGVNYSLIGKWHEMSAVELLLKLIQVSKEPDDALDLVVRTSTHALPEKFRTLPYKSYALGTIAKPFGVYTIVGAPATGKTSRGVVPLIREFGRECTSVAGLIVGPGANFAKSVLPPHTSVDTRVSLKSVLSREAIVLGVQLFHEAMANAVDQYWIDCIKRQLLAAADTFDPYATLKKCAEPIDGGLHSAYFRSLLGGDASILNNNLVTSSSVHGIGDYCTDKVLQVSRCATDDVFVHILIAAFLLEARRTKSDGYLVMALDGVGGVNYGSNHSQAVELLTRFSDKKRLFVSIDDNASIAALKAAGILNRSTHVAFRPHNMESKSIVPDFVRELVGNLPPGEAYVCGIGVAKARVYPLAPVH